MAIVAFDLRISAVQLFGIALGTKPELMSGQSLFLLAIPGLDLLGVWCQRGCVRFSS